MILIRLRLSFPAIVARTVLPASSSIENIPALNFSTTLPIISIASSLAKRIFNLSSCFAVVPASCCEGEAGGCNPFDSFEFASSGVV